MAGRWGALLRMLLLGALLLGGALPAWAAAVRLDSALLTDHTRPESPPRRVSLPDNWEFTAPQRDGSTSYRFALPDGALQDGAPVLFLRRAGNVFRVRLNDRLVTEVGEDTRPLANYGSEPHRIPLPPALLAPRDNVLEIELIGEPRREAGLSQVWVGSAAEVGPMFESAYREQLVGGWMVAGVCIAMALLSGLAAWRTSQPAYLWFALANGIWAWRMTGLMVHEPDFWAGPRVWFFHLSYSLYVASLMMFCASVVRPVVSASIGRPMIGFVGLSALLVTGNWLWNLPILRTLHLLLILLVVVGAAVLLGYIAWRDRSLPAGLLAVCATIAAVAGTRDWVWLRVLADHDAYTWSRFVSLPLMGVLTWLLVSDYARSQQELQELTRSQQATIEAKERELQQAFELRRDHERREATLAERDRILREMHDGLGGRLVGAIALARQIDAQPPPPGIAGELRGTLDDCLIELRLALDSLEVEQRSLVEALAEMRFRVEPSLRAAGIRLVWEVDDSAMDVELAGAATLHVLRIVREAFTNVIKHAGASTVRLTVLCGPQGVLLRVADNGVRPAPPPGAESASGLPGGHRGLASMQQRAQALGGRLGVGPQDEGWAVTLQLPLPGEASPRAMA